MTERATTPVAPDGFALGERLGSGGCAEVFRATELATGRPVALKFAWPNDARVRLSLARERHTLARVAHPSVPRVVAYGETDGRTWLALTLTEGSTLRAWSRPGGEPRELRELARCFARLCDALAYLHGEGVVHGDLSPDNVLVTDEGAPVLLDYGGAAWPAVVGRREALDAQARFQGTLSYAAPELLLERDADGRADLYALGCVLFEALTGAPPHAGSAAQVTAGHVWGAGDFAALRAVPEPMRALVSGLLAADPGARPPFADAVALALRGMDRESAQPTQPAQPRRPEPPALPARASLLRPTLVGRADERARLLAWADGEAPGFALVLGRAGMGKTRLLREIAFALEENGRAVCAVGTSPARDGAAPSASPFGPFISLLRALDARLDDDGAVIDPPLRDDLARLAPFFRDGSAAAVEPLAPSPGDSPRIENALALLRVLARWLGGERAFVLIDDLQWADDLTALALEVELRVGVLREARVSLLLACRPEALPPRLERLVAPEPLRERALRLELSPLDARAVPLLARESLGVTELPAALASVLAGATEGSPLLTGELLRLALTRGALYRLEGRWGLDSSSLNALPRDPNRVLDARIESLPAALEPALQAAAVLGRDVDRTLLASLLASPLGERRPHSTEAIDDALTALWGASVLEDDRAGRFRFAHDRLRDAALARVPGPVRARLHAAAARALEGRPRTEQTHALSARIAGHWLDAGRPREAAPHFERAALEAAQTGALEESCRAYRSLLELAPRVGATSAQRGAWQRALADALAALGRTDEARERYAEALASWGDRAPASRPAIALATAVEFAKQLASRALGPYAPRGATRPRDRDMARVLAAQPFLLSDDLVSLYSALRSVNLAERCGADDALALSQGFISALAFTAPLDAIGEHYFKLAEAALRRGGRAVLDTRTPLVFAYIRAMRAEWPEARRWLAVGLEAAERAGDLRLREDALSLRCDVELFVGEFETARALAERGLASALRRGDRQTTLWARCDLLRAALLAGHDPGPALRPLEDDALTAERTVLVDEVMLLGLRSLARARTGRHAGALDDARAALAAASRADGTIFILMHGCWPAAQTAHESHGLAERERTRLLRTAQEAMERVARYAAAARPRTRLVTAWRWLSEGKPARARDALSRGITEARAAGLERDATVLLRERDAATNPVAR